MTAPSVNGIFASPLVRAARSQDRLNAAVSRPPARRSSFVLPPLWVTPRALAGALCARRPGRRPRGALPCARS